MSFMYYFTRIFTSGLIKAIKPNTDKHFAAHNIVNGWCQNCLKSQVDIECNRLDKCVMSWPPDEEARMRKAHGVPNQ